MQHQNYHTAQTESSHYHYAFDVLSHNKKWVINFGALEITP